MPHNLNTKQTPAVANNVASSAKLAQPHKFFIYRRRVSFNFSLK